MISDLFKYTYLTYNFIVGSIYVLWIMLLHYNKCECSKDLLEKLIHIYWYIIFILDLLVFFNIFTINDLYLIIIGNVLGLVNIYMTYKYMKLLKDRNCKCSNMLLKDLIIIIYICTIVFTIAFSIGLLVSYLTKIS